METTLKQILDQAWERAQDYDGLTAMYSIDTEQTKMKHKVLDVSHNRSSFLAHIQKLFHTIREDDFEMLLVDLDERIVCKKIDPSKVIVFVAHKEMSLGKIFTLLRSVHAQGDAK